MHWNWSSKESTSKRQWMEGEAWIINNKAIRKQEIGTHCFTLGIIDAKWWISQKIAWKPQNMDAKILLNAKSINSRCSWDRETKECK